jgi:hypothetical protein
MHNGKPGFTWSNLVVDVACLGFAGWTIVCNVAVFLGANTHQLLAAAAVLLLAALSAFGLLVGYSGLQAVADFFTDDTKEEKPDDAGARDLSPTVRALAITAALGIAVAYAVERNFWILWACSCIYFAAAWWYVARSPIAYRTPRRSLPAEAALWALAWLGMWVTLSSRRYDIDDSFYVNLAVAVADFPELPLLRFDTIHGLGLPLHASFYRVHAFEPLAGLLSHVTGIETIGIIHLFFAGIAGLLTPLAAARLLRMLDSRRWLWAVMVVMVFYLYFPGPHRSFVCFAFVRLFQGKAVFLTVVVPLIAAYGIRLGRVPSRRNALFLAAAEIAGMGMTSSAVWLSPLIGLLAVAASFRFRRDDLKSLAYGALSSLYVLAVGAFLFLKMKGGQTGGGTGDLLGGGVSVKVQSEALQLVLGEGGILPMSMAIILLSWPLCRTALARRFLAISGLAFFLLLANPYLTAFLKSYVTGSTYWRVLWILPVPTMVALCFICVVGRPATTLGGRLQLGMVAAMLAAYLLTFTVRREVSWGLPRLKVPAEYAVARALNRSLAPGSYALAPSVVSQYLPTFNNYSYPLLAKAAYLRTNRADRLMRGSLVSYVSNARRKRLSYLWLRRGLNRYRVSGIAFVTTRQPGPWVDVDARLHAVLRRIGFRKSETLRNHEIWIRKFERKRTDRGSGAGVRTGVVVGGKRR